MWSLFLALATIGSVHADLSLVKALEEEILNRAIAPSSDSYLYVQVGSAIGDYDMRVMYAKDIERFLVTDWNFLPDHILHQFRVTGFSNTTVFESFEFRVGDDHISTLENTVGAVLMDRGILQIAFLRAKAFGKLHQQYDHKEVEVCDPPAWFGGNPHCHTVSMTIKRGFNTHEVVAISQALKGRAYIYLKNIILYDLPTMDTLSPKFYK